MTIVGVDTSTHAIHLSWLDEQGRPQRWHQKLEGKHLIDRLRVIRVYWPDETNEIAVEYPFAQARPAIAALMSVVGIVTRQAPSWARVAWPSSGELRAAIGARNTKQDAHDKLMERFGLYVREDLQYWPSDLHDWDEHELDALVAAVGWARILEAQDAT